MIEGYSDRRFLRSGRFLLVIAGIGCMAVIGLLSTEYVPDESVPLAMSLAFIGDMFAIPIGIWKMDLDERFDLTRGGILASIGVVALVALVYWILPPGSRNATEPVFFWLSSVLMAVMYTTGLAFVGWLIRYWRMPGSSRQISDY